MNHEEKKTEKPKKSLGVKEQYAKITWLSRAEALKQLVVIIGVSVIACLFITGADTLSLWLQHFFY